ncbi:probable G-protein coupled receptor 158 isoform X2 [Oryzias latipes]|uniref:probable G-protein coupled receptor 158 isoform X2 n=1 Tax=Oryzias latipes TaxID=8090 RepID=UPI000CE28A46|nr:probable G-protein coupled receptor 158 isoform X2 [Oryzias latipes]
MSLLWLLLLLTASINAQLTSDFETVNATEASRNVTRSSELSTDPNGSSFPTIPSEPAGTPTEAPTEEDDWSAAETFLYTGDPSILKVARCSRSYSAPGQAGPLPANFLAPLQAALDALANTANFLNMIFQASDLRESTVQEDMEWYHALVRALLEADVLIQQSLLTFDPDPTALAPQLVLRASRNSTAKVQNIVLQDLSKAWESLHPPAPAPDDGWFRELKFSESNQPRATLSKRVLLNDLNTLDTPKWGQGDSYVTNCSGVRWANSPFLDCKDGRFVPGWVLTLSTSFYGLKPDLTPEFRGVIRVDVNIQDIDLNQCATGNRWFADTHQCNRTSMECVPVPGRGFRLGQYCCRCREGYYDPEVSPDGSDGGPGTGRDSSGKCYPNMPICLPCWPGCRSCQDSTPCWVQEDWPLRAGVLAIQGLFMLLVFVSMLVAYQHRRDRRIRASGLLLLETILFGSLLLYFPVFILFFKPSNFRCILLRWVRMLGFSIVYGTITLKMYRVLKVFLSRTAQRVPYMSSLHLLRILGVMLMTVSWFLCAWTVGVLQNQDRNIPVFVTATTADGQGFNLCYLDRWDYMMAVAELLFLCWGSSLWTAVRPVPSAFHEPRYMGIAIHNELLFSSIFHLFRFTFTSLHPDWMLLLSFTHTHVTITVTLALLLGPKFLYTSKPVRDEIAAEVYEDEVDLRRSGSYLNNSFRSAWSEHNVDPEDFREELKKLYSQLEVHKTKKMSANNPHLPKKRSSRCALGRSLIKRIAEIPETVSRQCSREDRDGSFQSRAGSFRSRAGSFLSRGGNPSDSFMITPETISISYRSSIKSPSPSIRKSQSDHYHTRDSTQRESMLRTNSVKRSSQRSETDSLDITPGVCKSASALNLTIDTNLLHPDHNRLHKSWSLCSSTTNSIENVSKISRSSTMRSRQSISDQTRSALQSESFDKAEICPWELETEQSGEKSHKHVTYAKSEEGDEKGPSSPQALVCPWDHLPPVENTPSVEKVQQNDNFPLKIPVTVSASVPGSPRPKAAKDQRAFSFRATTNKWLSVKSFMTSIDGSRSATEGNHSREGSQKSHESTSTTSWSGTSSRRPSLDRRSLQHMGMSTTDGKPCLVKQNAVRMSSADSSERSPRRLVIVKSVVYPRDADDLQKEGNYENVILSRQSSRRSSITSWETASSSRTPSTRRRSSRIRPVYNVSHTDVCPWEGSTQEKEGPKKQQSIKPDVSHQLMPSEQSSVCPWESPDQGNLKQESGKTEVCPWESKDIPGSSQITRSKDSQTQSLKRVADVCPWEVAETPQISIRQDSDHGNVCPWDVQDKSEAVYENVNLLENKGTLTVPLRREVMKSAIYPGAPKDCVDNNQQPSTLNQSEPKTDKSCPWDFPDPPKIIEDICPWESGDKESITEDSVSRSTNNLDICPWETGNQDKPSNSGKVISMQSKGPESSKVNVCPWETEITGRTAATKQDSRKVKKIPEVCPWEAVGPESDRQDTPKSSKSNAGNDTARTNVCPWETDEQGVAKTGKLNPDNPSQEVSQSKTNTAKGIKKLDSAQANVCPWETEEPRILKKQDSTLADVCPWEKEEPRILKKQDSSRADVCPWDSEEPRILKKQDSTLADVCPWEKEEPRILKKQDSSRADVCPWDSEEPRILKKQDSAQADVCPWETEEPRILKKQDSGRADVCRWESKKPPVLQKQDSARANVCPWENEDDTKVVTKQDSLNADAGPLENKEMECSGKNESNGTDGLHVPSSVNDKVLEDQQVLNEDETPGYMSPEQTDETKANMALGRRDALCPWEIGSFTDNTSDVFTWEPENIPEEDEEDDAECAAEALVFPPDL